jgi:hypothetical protein
MKSRYGVLVYLFLLSLYIEAESLRAYVVGDLHVSRDNPAGASVSLSYTDSVLISLDDDVRFFRGIELELDVPQAYQAYRGSLAIVLYAELDKTPVPGVADLEGRQLAVAPIPNKIQTIYQIPIRSGHGMRASPYVSIPTGIIDPSSFPILFRLIPVTKGLHAAVESMVFRLNVKPVLSNEGAVKIRPRFPEHLQYRPFTVLIDDTVVEAPGEERLLREGEHHLMILSEDYRNENRRFLVERAKVLDLVVELQDPTPLLVFEAPENTRIYLDNVAVTNTLVPHPVVPGVHEVKFQMSDYSIVKLLSVQKGKTYKVVLSVDVNISETE